MKHDRLIALALASACWAAPFHGALGSDAKEPALETLRELARSPALREVRARRQEKRLVTGSIVRAHGRDAVFYHLPDNGTDLRLHGETGEIAWAMPIAQEQLKGAVSLRLAYTNAVSVMPEASNLTVSVNGVELGTRPIQSPDRPRQLSFDVPPNVLVPGYNAVRVSARQRHRVDCSIDATHELWTQIEPAQSGFVFERGNSVLGSLDALSAIARNKAGQVRLRILAPAALDRSQVERTMLLAQHAAVFADYRDPAVQVAGQAGQGPGLDVFMGTLEELRQVAPDYADSVEHSAALQVLSRDGEERVALVMLELQPEVSGDIAVLRKRLADIFRKRPLRGSPEGLSIAVSQSGVTVPTGTDLAFDKLGIASQEFDGRLYRRSMTVRLPADFYPADYAQADVNLATAYAAGLSRSNKFIVRVNGVTVTGFALSRPNGYVFRNKQLRLPLSAFRPGTNRIEMEVQLGRPGERACDPAAQIAGEKRFVLSGRSTIRFPNMAHLARLPDLAGTVATGFPYVVDGKPQPTVISVPGGGYPELSVAAGFATQVAVRAGLPLGFRLAYAPPSQEVRNAIVVGAFDTLPPAIAQGIEGVDLERFRTAWLSGAPVVASARGSGDGVDAMTTAGIRPVPPARVASDPLDAWGLARDTPVPAEEAGRSLGFGQQFGGLLTSVFDGAFRTGKATAPITDTDTDLLITQRIAPGHPDGVWTLLTAKSRDTLLSGAALMSRASVRERIAGQTAAIDGVDRTVTSSIATQNYVQVRGFSLRNAQLIVAGWFSNNHMLYSVLLLLLLCGGGVITTFLLRSVGAREGHGPGEGGR